jgi:hypothetical protein
LDSILYKDEVPRAVRIVEDFPSLGIYKFDLSGMRFKTSFGGGNLNVNDLHHQIRFGIWIETVYIWNSKWREVLQYKFYNTTSALHRF